MKETVKNGRIGPNTYLKPMVRRNLIPSLWWKGWEIWLDLCFHPSSSVAKPTTNIQNLVGKNSAHEITTKKLYEEERRKGRRSSDERPFRWWTTLFLHPMSIPLEGVGSQPMPMTTPLQHKLENRGGRWVRNWRWSHKNAKEKARARVEERRLSFSLFTHWQGFNLAKDRV